MLKIKGVKMRRQGTNYKLTRGQRGWLYSSVGRGGAGNAKAMGSIAVKACFVFRLALKPLKLHKHGYDVTSIFLW